MEEQWPLPLEYPVSNRINNHPRWGVIIRDLLPQDIFRVNQEEQVAHVRDLYSWKQARELADEKHSWAFVNRNDGSILACAGIHEYWDGYGVAWAFVDATIGRQMMPLVRAIKRYLDLSPFHRIEAMVDCEFENGHRLVKLLGFTKECILRNYSADKRDHVQYSIVRDI